MNIFSIPLNINYYCLNISQKLRFHTNPILLIICNSKCYIDFHAKVSQTVGVS